MSEMSEEEIGEEGRGVERKESHTCLGEVVEV
jgi:hypothetical protein